MRLKQAHLDQLILLAEEYQNIRLKLQSDSRQLDRLSKHHSDLYFHNYDIQIRISGIMDIFEQTVKDLDDLNKKIRMMDVDDYA